MYRRNPQNVDELRNIIFEEQESINDKIIVNLVDSFKARLAQVIEKKGEMIDY